MGHHLTQEQSQLLKKAYFINDLRSTCKVIDVDFKKAFSHCQSKGYRINPVLKKVKDPKLYTIHKQAEIIEEFLLGVFSLKELGLKHGIVYSRVSHIISKYFPYKGYDGVCITLGSKV